MNNYHPSIGMVCAAARSTASRRESRDRTSSMNISHVHAASAAVDQQSSSMRPSARASDAQLEILLPAPRRAAWTRPVRQARDPQSPWRDSTRSIACRHGTMQTVFHMLLYMGETIETMSRWPDHADIRHPAWPPSEQPDLGSSWVHSGLDLGTSCCQPSTTFPLPVVALWSPPDGHLQKFSLSLSLSLPALREGAGHAAASSPQCPRST